MQPIKQFVVALALLLAPFAVMAQETPVQIFRGLTTIETSVIGVTPAMEAEGLYDRDIYDDVDRRLRGTRLLLRRGRAQPLAGTGVVDPLLQVTPICRPGSGGRQICHVTVELRDRIESMVDQFAQDYNSVR